jgi:1-deoxy-D-xylulose-5-phosphate synthase
MGEELVRLAHHDRRIVAITAAMKYAVGLNDFSNRFAERFFDVGIAEAHAVTFAGGLASQGLVPVFCVYSSFLQRAYDQLIEDLAIAGLHAVLCIDRAGFVGEDGETHQGLFDIPMLTTVPGVTIYSPSTIAEMQYRLKNAIDESGIVAVRYPRGTDETAGITNASGTSGIFAKNMSEGAFDDSPYTLTHGNGNDSIAVGYGRQFNFIEKAVKKSGNFDTLKLNRVFPVEIPVQIYSYKSVVIFEESQKSGGIAEHIAAVMSEHGFAGKIKIVAVNGFVPQGTIESQLRQFDLDTAGVLKTMAEVSKSRKKAVRSKDESHAT